jgi:integrase
MRIYRNGENWWCDFRHQGRRIRRSTGTSDRKAAQEYADRLKATLWRAEKLGERPAVTWDAAVIAWLDDHAALRSIEDRRDHLRWATTVLAGQHLDAIDNDVLDRLARKRKATRGGRRGNRALSDPTVNRYMASILAVLRFAHAKGWRSSQPAWKPRREPENRLLWASKAQAAKLLAALPAHLRALAAFSIATGLRQENATHLEWSRVDLRRRVVTIEAASAKGKRAIGIPLSAEAVAILEAQRRAPKRHRRWVFPYRGAPMDNPAQDRWKAAVRKAKLPAAFTWHCLRHTFASWHVQAGTPLPVLKELGAWRDIKTVMRYAHLAPDHLAAYADNVTIGGRAA